MILCPQLVMACEFSLGLLPYIKILLSSPTFHMPLRMGRVRVFWQAASWIFVAAILVVPFELLRRVWEEGEWDERHFCSFIHNLIRGGLAKGKQKQC